MQGRRERDGQCVADVHRSRAFRVRLFPFRFIFYRRCALIDYSVSCGRALALSCNNENVIVNCRRLPLELTRVRAHCGRDFFRFVHQSADTKAAWRQIRAPLSRATTTAFECYQYMAAPYFFVLFFCFIAKQ